MARFVYQPVPAGMEQYSKHGQIIADIYSGHISVNHNNVIVSSSKRIEGKLEDVFQIESNIIEQKNVINNLRDDIYSIIDHKYNTMYEKFRDIQVNCGVTKGKVSYIRNGIGGDGFPVEDCILQKLINSIYGIRDLYQSTANLQLSLVGVVNDLFTGGNAYINDDTNAEATGKNITDSDNTTHNVRSDKRKLDTSKKFHGYSLSNYIAMLNEEIEEERTNIELARTNVEAKLMMHLYYEY